MAIKVCKQCCLEKDSFPFSYSKDKLKKWERSICTECSKVNRKIYSKNNREKINKKMSEYRNNNSDKIKEHKKKYYKNNKEKILINVKKYYENNIEKINMYYNDYVKNNKEKIANKLKKYNIENKDKIKLAQRVSYRNNPATRIRKILSSKIRVKLLESDSSKNSISIFKHLPYTIDELKNHLESQFETWMSWENYGVYRSNSWKDDDKSTWTWQIDHIIPHSYFKYTSMEDSDFVECWSLNNLRPLSSKQNLIDGDRR